jgi:transposase
LHALSLEQADVAVRLEVFDVPSTLFDVIKHRTLVVTCAAAIQFHD